MLLDFGLKRVQHKLGMPGEISSQFGYLLCQKKSQWVEVISEKNHSKVLEASIG